MLNKENKEFAYAFLADRESYHTQKENSAYAVFIVEASLYGALMTTNIVPSFLKHRPGSDMMLVIFIIVVWCLLHVFMRWQLINRRIAALQVSTLITALTDHLNHRSARRGNRTHTGCRFDVYLDYIVPLPKSTHKGDIELAQYPGWYRAQYAMAQKKGTRAGFGEIFPTYGSIVMLLTAILNVWLSWLSMQ
jgi:hypothetical protein